MASITFNEGVPSRVKVTLPVGDRYHGGFFCRIPKVYGYSDEIPGVTFDGNTREFVYDGRPLSDNSYNGVSQAVNPSSFFWAGAETGPHNPHWQFPPRTINIPQAVGGVQQAITGGCKHTRPRFCPRDNLIHICGGDYSSAGIIKDGHQDGRMLLWNFDPVVNKWGFDYPPMGRAGDDIPLSPDAMGFAWDKSREIWWITYGDPRAGVQNDVHWKSLGGLATAYPASALAWPINDAPVFTFDPKVGKYNKLGIMPWNIMSPKTREHAYDDTSKRLYKLDASSTLDLRVRWLDTTNYETDPLNMPWSMVDISLSAIGHRYATGYFESPCHIDEVKRLLYFVDSRTPAVLALTLPGHPSGEHKVSVLAPLPQMKNYALDMPMGLLAMASMPFVWIPEHRCLVMMVEPLYEQVGPWSNSFQIDVDTGVVSDGPRFPSKPADGKPWFPNAAVWFPPTQELIVYAFYPNSQLSGTQSPETMHAYKWVD